MQRAATPSAKSPAIQPFESPAAELGPQVLEGLDGAEVEPDAGHGARDGGRQARPEGEDAALGAGDDAAHDGDAPADPRGPPGLLGGGRHVLLQPRLDEVERLEEEAAAGARGRPGQEGLDDGVGGDVLLHGFTLLFSHLFFAFTSFQCSFHSYCL